MKRSVGLATVLVPALVIGVLAVPGVLDTTFGLAGTGKVLTPLGTGRFNQQANDIAVDSDNTIVAVGTVPASTGNGDIGVARYGDIGHPFLTVITDLDGDETGAALAIDGDHRIVVAGSTNNTCLGTCDHGYDFFVARYTTSGSLDTSFAGGKGWRQMDLGSDADIATAVAIDSLGRIIVAGTTVVHGNNGDYHNIALARLLPNGDLDTAFDGDGLKTVSLGTNVGVAINGLAINTSNGLVLAGRVGVFPAVVRLQETGDVYQYFGNNGVATVGTRCFGEFRDLAIDAWQRIVAAGDCTDGNMSARYIAVGRFTRNGQRDSTFNGGFPVVAEIGTSGYRYATGVAVDALGRVTVAGYVLKCDFDFVVLRLRPDGSFDSHFGNAGPGVTTTDFGPALQCSQDRGHALIIDRKGRYVVAGGSGSFATGMGRFALARYLGDQQDFAVTVTPLTVAPGSSASTVVTVASIDGFDELLKFGLYGTNTGDPLPAGFSQANAVNVDPVAWGTTTEMLTVNVDSSVSPGTYTFWLIDERFRDHAAAVVVDVVTSVPLVQDAVERYTSSGHIKSTQVTHVLLRMLRTAQSFGEQGQIGAAVNKYASTINYIEAQAGRGIATSAEEDGVTFDPSDVLINLVTDLARQLTN